jgi:DNA-binding HxlR family transcriptional regulator
MNPRQFDSAVHCDEAFEEVFSLLGKRWSGLIVGILLQRPARFAEIARAIPGISDGMLSARLTELRRAGLVEREVIDGPPIGALYLLTYKGEALRPALAELAKWAEGYLRPLHGLPLGGDERAGS